MTHAQPATLAEQPEGLSALELSASLEANNLAETLGTLALARACAQLRLASANYQRIGHGPGVTRRLQRAIALIEAAFDAAQRGE